MNPLTNLNSFHPASILAEASSFWRDLWLRGASASDIGRESDEMFMFLFWFCVVWFVGLMALMAYFVWKYRARKGVAGPRSSSHNTPLEITWTIVPTILLVVIFFKGFWAYIDKVVAPGDSMELNLTGFRWSWTLAYPNGAETTEFKTIGSRPVPIFYLPEDTNVRFRMNSSDVMHSFWIPDYRIKQDLLPNRYTQVWIRSAKTEAGSSLDHPKPFLKGQPYTEHMIFCAEYCGNEHSEMAAVLRIVPKPAFEAWLKDLAENVDPVTLGQNVWRGKCMSCHSVDGSDNTGPTWLGLRTRDSAFQDGSVLTVAQKADDTVFENYILESTRYPAKQVVVGRGNNMTAFPPSSLSDKQLSGVIAYIKTLSPAK
jgi:cytochrome c oxidase subunit 2